MPELFPQEPGSHIAQTATDVGDHVHEWEGRYAPGPNSRADATSLAVAIGAPKWSTAELVVIAKSILWFFALDDVFDERRASDAAMARLCERLVAKAAGHSSTYDGESAHIFDSFDDMM